MATINVNTVELVSTLRPAPTNGSPSSSDYNDSQKEQLVDLAAITTLINGTILPLLNALDAGALLPVNAPVGIAGATIYSDVNDSNQLFFDATANQPLTLAASLRLLNGMLDTFNTQLTDMGISVAALQTRLASDNRNDIALALQNITNTLNVLTATQSTQANLIAALQTQDNKIQTKRLTTGAVTATNTVDLVVTWTTPFADNNYTVALVLQKATLADDIEVQGFTYQLNGVGITAHIVNFDGVNTLTATLHATAQHD